MSNYKHQLYLQLDAAEIALSWAKTYEQEEAIARQIEQIKADLAKAK
jgi:hypothetical protein